MCYQYFSPIPKPLLGCLQNSKRWCPVIKPLMQSQLAKLCGSKRTCHFIHLYNNSEIQNHKSPRNAKLSVLANRLVCVPFTLTSVPYRQISLGNLHYASRYIKWINLSFALPCIFTEEDKNLPNNRLEISSEIALIIIFIFSSMVATNGQH